MEGTTSINDLFKGSEAYSATASLTDGGLQTTKITGDRTTDAFTQAAGDEMGKMDFLTLLTTQLKYQDPMEPADNTEFVAQLAQFSQLETMSNVSTSMEGLEKSFTDSLGIQSNSAQSITNSSAVSLIGKEVRIRQNDFEWLGSGEATFNVHLGESESVVASVLDEDGEIVKEFEINEKDITNAGTFTWDGTNVNGMPVEAGIYQLHISGQEQDPSLYCYVEDTVSGVRYDVMGPVVKVAGKEMPIGNILEVNTVVGGSSGETLDLTMSQALGLVGKSVKYADSGTSFAPKVGGTREYSVDFGGSSTATIVVKDANGVVAETFNISNDGTGMKSFELPLDDRNGTGGKYTVSIEGNPNAFFYKNGEISGVTPTGSGVQLKVEGMQISAKDILEVYSS